MNRRGFLGAFASLPVVPAAALAVILTPDKEPELNLRGNTIYFGNHRVLVVTTTRDDGKPDHMHLMPDT